MTERGLRAGARAIAFYLPQYHPIPENDEWWGKGFTEWTNVANAKPLFRGHWQPRLPADLGFYDLRVPEVRVQQAKMADDAGIEGFCYWHYWFGNGRRALERVFDEVQIAGSPDFPFCLAWANESWTGRWHGLDSLVIFKQEYPGIEDYKNHFDTLLPAFRDPRYIEVDGRKLFVIYRPEELPDISAFIDCWNSMATRHGLNGFFFVSGNERFFLRHPHGLDGAIRRNLSEVMRRLPCSSLVNFLRRSGVFPEIQLPRLCTKPTRRRYSDFVEEWASIPIPDNVFPSVFPNWDNTPRCGKRGDVLVQSTPNLFKQHVENELAKISPRPLERRIIFIKSWNEWAEGNYLEPDHRFGRGYLDVLKDCLL